MIEPEPEIILRAARLIDQAVGDHRPQFWQHCSPGVYATLAAQEEAYGLPVPARGGTFRSAQRYRIRLELGRLIDSQPDAAEMRAAMRARIEMNGGEWNLICHGR